MVKIKELRDKLDIDIELSILKEVLLHTSYLNENKNEKILLKNKIRLGIGKSLISLVSKLYYIKETTYTLSEITNKINQESLLIDIYNEYNLDQYIYVGKGERQNTNTLYIDNVTMIIYEIYKKHGLIKLYNFLKKFIIRNENIDYKTLLQEYVQSFKEYPIYKVIDSKEGTHNNYYTVEVSALGKRGVGTYSSKKGAEKLAAKAFFKDNNIDIQNANKNKNIGLLRKGYSWNVSEERKKNILLGISPFRFSENDVKLPAYIWDASFTHKSIQSKTKDTNAILITLGADIINIYIQEYLMDNMVRYLNNNKLFNMEKAMILKEENLEIAIINLYGKKWLKTLDITGEVDYKKLSVETYKSLLGAILYYNFCKKDDIPDTLNSFYRQSIEELEIIDKEIDLNDYKNWLIDLEQSLGVIVYKKDEKSYGSDNNRRHYSKLIMNLESYQLANIEVEAEESNKAALNYTLSKKMYFKLKKLCNFSYDSELQNQENYNIFLRDILKYILIKNVFINTKIGLLGNNKINGQILNNLYKKGLYKEIKMIMDSNLISIDEINESINSIYEIKFFKQNEYKKDDRNLEEIYIQKNILLDENINFENEVEINKMKYYKINKKGVDVLFKIIKFNSSKCHYCNGNLESRYETIFTTSNERIYPILTEVSCCPICEVYGLNYEQEKDMREKGCEYRVYKGSAAYYSSCIIRFNDLDVFLPNESKFKIYTKKATTPEELDYQLKILKSIGLRGEEIIYNYEKDLLIKMGKPELAEKVEWVSKRDCTAGYDILSYDIYGIEKYIEVKSSTGTSNKFYLSKNEIDISKMYGDNYYIYKVNNIRSTPYINKIRNPMQCIELGQLEIQPTQFSVSF